MSRSFTVGQSKSGEPLSILSCVAHIRIMKICVRLVHFCIVRRACEATKSMDHPETRVRRRSRDRTAFSRWCLHAHGTWGKIRHASSQIAVFFYGSSHVPRRCGRWRPGWRLAPFMFPTHVVSSGRAGVIPRLNKLSFRWILNFVPLVGNDPSTPG